MKKVLALILAVLMLLPILVACGNNGDGSTTTKAPETSTPATPGATTAPITDTNPNGENTTAPETTPESTQPSNYKEPPQVKYDNYDFRVLSTVDFSSATAWGNYEIVVADEALLVATTIS